MLSTILLNIIETKKDAKDGKIEIMQAVNLLLFETASTAMCLFGIIKAKVRADELNALSTVIINSQNYGLKSLFGKNSFNCLRKTSKIYITVTTIVGLMHVGQVLSIIFINKLEFKYTAFRGFSSLFCLLITFTFLFQFAIKLKILRIMFLKCYGLIQGVLTNAATPNHTDITFVNERKWPLIKILQKLQRFHCAIILNIKVINKNLHPFLLFEFIVTVMMLIICYYLLSSAWILGKERTPISFLVEFKTYCIIFAMAYTLFFVEKLKEPVSSLKIISIFFEKGKETTTLYGILLNGYF